MEDGQAVAREIQRQLAEFRRLTGRKPSHLDSHQHAHRDEPVRAIMLDLARQLSVPLRECSPHVAYRGDFYGQTGEGETLPEAISVKNLKRILGSLSNGVSELGCHPGFADDLQSPYRQERAEEVRVLCHPKVRATVAELELQLCTFEDVARVANPVPSPGGLS